MRTQSVVNAKTASAKRGRDDDLLLAQKVMVIQCSEFNYLSVPTSANDPITYLVDGLHFVY